jgi:hypothetical protein
MGVGKLLYDVTARNTAAHDRIELLRRDFQVSGGSFRASVGRRLVNLGLRLAGEELRVVPPRAAWPSEAYP